MKHLKTVQIPVNEIRNHPEFPVLLPGAKADTLMWLHPHDTEPAALDQLRNIAALPWTHSLRVMPDAHLGKGATVGSVVAMRNAVSPSAVGVDVGCGMVAVQTSATLADLPDDLASLRSEIEKAIPVGFNANNGAAPVLKRDRALASKFDSLMGGFGGLRAEGMADREGRAVAQCGSLGGGNHFIEITADESGAIWAVIHSGSRNAGKELAERHITKAKGLDHNLDLPDRDLAVFLAGTPGMDDYLADLFWAQDYAALNRSIMMATLKSVLSRFMPTATYGREVNCHHNYVALEQLEGGEELIVTRKGAISAKSGEYGLIPGSMGTGSYVVKGLGNTLGLCSASHGAGRKMSRSKAKKIFTVDDLAEQTRGVECRKDAGVVDEIPGAYKDLGAVIAAQTDLVDIEARLTTLLCVKG